ncbi:MAG: hypothetical protein IH830_01910 [Planctomycetes bacterium]|nr:hypothetical protein [Planctomycetota bacterium]
MLPAKQAQATLWAIGRFFAFWFYVCPVRAFWLAFNHSLSLLLGGLVLSASLYVSLPVLASWVGKEEALHEANYIKHGLVALGFAAVALFVLFIIVAPASMYWEQKDELALGGIDTTGRLRKLKKLKAEGESIKVEVPKYESDASAIPAWKGKLIRWQSDVLIEIEDHKLAEAFKNPPEPSAEQKQQCELSRFTEMKECLIRLDRQLLILDDVISDLGLGH